MGCTVTKPKPPPDSKKPVQVPVKSLPQSVSLPSTPHAVPTEPSETHHIEFSDPHLSKFALSTTEIEKLNDPVNNDVPWWQEYSPRDLNNTNLIGKPSNAPSLPRGSTLSHDEDDSLSFLSPQRNLPALRSARASFLSNKSSASTPRQLASPEGGRDVAAPHQSMTRINSFTTITQPQVSKSPKTNPPLKVRTNPNQFAQKRTHSLPMSTLGHSAAYAASVSPNASAPRSMQRIESERLLQQAGSTRPTPRAFPLPPEQPLSVLQQSLAKRQLKPYPVLTRPSCVNDFKFKCLIGTGSFGQVHLVERLDNGQMYALKIMQKQRVRDNQQVQHILSEKETLKSVQHPFLIRLHDSFQDHDYIYMVMDYMVGGEMFSYLRVAFRFADDTARFYAASIVLAFEYLHSRNIVYRDLKPENVLIDKNGYVQIVDFGFAKVVLDRTFTLCGTPEYLAPEIIQSKGHNKAVDWWALGILIYEMLCGYPPFSMPNQLQTFQAILDAKPHFPPHLTPQSRDLIQRLLTVNVSERIGCLKDGAEDVKNHSWFEDVDWDELLLMNVPAPIIPKFSDPESDTRNYEFFDPATVWKPGSPLLAPDDFANF